MDFPKSRAVVGNLAFVPKTGSTNRDLLERAADPAIEDFFVLVTDYQSLGRGRLDRSWEASPQSSIMASVLLRPDFANSDGLGWMTMATALAIKKVTDSLLTPGNSSGIKWPNDVLVDGLKLSGILAELSPDLKTVVVGFGINVHQLPEDIGFTSATSLRMLGASSLDRDEILAGILLELKSLYLSLRNSGGDADLSGVRDQLLLASSTIGEQVQAQLSDGTSLTGLATDVDSSGRLVIETNAGEIRLSAGDIQHLRSR